MRKIYRKLVLGKGRKLHDTEECYFEMIPIDDHSAEFKLLDESMIQKTLGLSPLEQEIVDAIGNNKTITRENLLNALGDKNGNSFLNSLKKLERKKYISKADGKSWKIINNLKIKN